MKRPVHPVEVARLCHFARSIYNPSTMASKRKRTENRSSTSTSERRSSRRIKGQTDDSRAVKRQTRDEGPGLSSQESVRKAMHDLGEMELRLANQTKSQRLAIEASDLSIDENMAPKTNGVRERKQSRPQRGVLNQKSNAESEGLEQAPMDSRKADLAVGDIEAAAEQADVEEDAPDSAERGARRDPPVNSDKLPLPWKGRLGYACLNTYLRAANPPVFSSRTCRIQSILDHRHPLADPSQPEHSTKNRPDKSKPAEVARGMKYVQDLGLANVRDISKMIKWNDKYGIKFMRLSSEMFPFASHDEYGYKLAPFASEALAEAGRVIANLGHRVTTHPGQFTQIASPRKEVVTAAFRDLEYHNEMLSLLNLPEQQDRDAVMILHMGGVYGDKVATLKRFQENYINLSDAVKRRLVLENDDVAWSVHDLLPTCEELNIPLVLDYHHHNIIFDPSIREGTLDVIQLYDRIHKTWARKGITQKMHYSEPTAPAISPRDRRKHSARVRTLPPCAQTMDLMIEAKDKEQAVFDLMRHFKLPGWDLFNNIVPNERDDESKKAVKKPKKPQKRTKITNGHGDAEDDVEIPEIVVADEDFGMGGPQRRVYWPEGMEDWLRPKKRESKKSGSEKNDGKTKKNPAKEEEDED